MPKLPPPEALQELASGLSAWREFTRPLPIDHQYHTRLGPQARGHLAVFDYKGERQGFKLQGYQRSPWAVLKAQHRRFLARASLGPDSSGGAVTFAMNDEGGTSRSFILFRDASGATAWDNVPATQKVKLKYGSNGAAAADTDNDIGTQLGANLLTGGIVADATFRVSASAARIHSEADATAREIAIFQKRQADGFGAVYILWDHTVIADQGITSGQTVTVSYEFQL